VGTLTLSGSGTLNARLGAETAFAVTLVVGVALLFVGFLVATSASTARPARAASVSALALPEDAAQDLPRQAFR
jgi:hypothetical protein